MTPRFSSFNIRRQNRSNFQFAFDLPDVAKRTTTKKNESTKWYLRIATIAAVALMALPMHSAWAADETEEEKQQQDSRWGLGLGVGAMQKAYRDIDSETLAIPIIIYDSKWISVNGGTISLKLPSAGPVSFALSADISRDGYEASDSDALAGMDEREDGFWLGGSLTWENDIADLSASWTTDMSGNSDGQKLSISAARSFEQGKFEFTPRVGAVWLDENYVDYYYGVKANEVTAERGFYAPDATVNLEAGFRTTYEVTPRNSIFLDLSASALGSEIKDSPIVDGSTESRIFMGYVHMF